MVETTNYSCSVESKLGIAWSARSNRIGASPHPPEDEGKSILQTTLIFKVLKLLETIMNKVHNEALPKTFRKL